MIFHQVLQLLGLERSIYHKARVLDFNKWMPDLHIVKVLTDFLNDLNPVFERHFKICEQQIDRLHSIVRTHYNCLIKHQFAGVDRILSVNAKSYIFYLQQRQICAEDLLVQNLVVCANHFQVFDY